MQHEKKNLIKIVLLALNCVEHQGLYTTVLTKKHPYPDAASHLVGSTDIKQAMGIFKCERTQWNKGIQGQWEHRTGMEQIWRTRRLSRGYSIWDPMLSDSWLATWKGKEFSSKWSAYIRGSGRGGAGNTEDCSRMFNLDKVDGEEITHLSELSPSEFCIWSHLVQDNCLERRLLFTKLSVLRRTSIILNSIHCLEYNHDSKWHLIEACSNGGDFLKGISDNLVIG